MIILYREKNRVIDSQMLAQSLRTPPFTRATFSCRVVVITNHLLGTKWLCETFWHWTKPAVCGTLFIFKVNRMASGVKALFFL